NDNDGAIFSTDPSVGTWMTQLHSKYLSSWNVFQSPFDTRSPSELGTVATPISYGINGTANFVGTSVDKISQPTIFILFAPAQTSDPASVTFGGTAATVAPGVTVNKNVSTPGGSYAGTAPHGTHSSRGKINALFADLHLENMTWSVFANNPAGSDLSTIPRWSP